MKRYAIVRVEQQCPFTYEKQDKRAFLNRCLISTYQCKDCYGDTKEQMIRKVAQAIKRELKGDCVAGLKDTVFVMKWCIVETLAKKIVEFLGVEE